MAFAGQTSTQAPHLLHSGMRIVCGSSCSGHASTHVWQSTPRLRRHVSAFTRGRSVTLRFDSRLTSALMGQILLHHLRSTVTSRSRIIGKMISAQVGSSN